MIYICQEWHVKSDILWVTYLEWHVVRGMLRVTCKEWHVKRDNLRGKCWELHVTLDISIVTCLEWYVESDNSRVTFKNDVLKVTYWKWHGNWIRQATFYHPSMPPLFNVLTFLGVSSRTFILSKHKLVHSKIDWDQLLGTTHISVSVSLRFGLSKDPLPLLYRVPQKKREICLVISISIKLYTKLLGIYFIWKIRSIAPSGVQTIFCKILGSCDISKSK